MKYVILNCPAYKGSTPDETDWQDYTACGHYTGGVYCQDETDCLLKQIVEKCNDTKEAGHNELANKILELLDIQEIEE